MSLSRGLWAAVAVTVMVGGACSVADQYSHVDCRTGYRLCEEYCGDHCEGDAPDWESSQCARCLEKCQIDGRTCDEDHRTSEDGER